MGCFGRVSESIGFACGCLCCGGVVLHRGFVGVVMVWFGWGGRG